jgi:hypothetical protein
LPAWGSALLRQPFLSEEEVLRLRFPFVLLSALAAFAIPAGSAFAIPGATFTVPGTSANISHGQTLSVDTSNVPAAVGVDFYTDSTSTPGTPGGYLGGYSIHGQNYSGNGNVYSLQVDVSGWALPSDPNDSTTPYPLTFDAVLVDITGAPIVGAMVQKNVTIANGQAPLVRGSFSPSASGTKSGTIALSLTPSDQNNVITAGSFSVDGGVTTYPLTSDGSGHWSAPVDTVALGVPNGALDIRVHLEDAPGNMSDTDIFYTVGNPQAPVITPGTLVADKARYRTDETQLEVGDIVEAYGMQATGYPAPVIQYSWNFCSGPNGQTCHGVTPGADGSYTVQPGDVGSDLMLVATASNGVGRPDFTLVEFGIIAPAYVAPVDNGAGDGPQSGDAPQADPTPAPVVTPPVVTPPVVSPPHATFAEEQAVVVAEKAVTVQKVAVVKAKAAVANAEKKVAKAKQKVADAKAALATGSATTAEKVLLVVAQKQLVAAKDKAEAKVSAAKVAAAKLVARQKQLAAKKAATRP